MAALGQFQTRDFHMKQLERRCLGGAGGLNFSILLSALLAASACSDDDGGVGGGRDAGASDGGARDATTGLDSGAWDSGTPSGMDGATTDGENAVDGGET